MTEQPVSENFEDYFWNKYEQIHKRYKTKIKCMENIIEILSKVHSLMKDARKAFNTLMSNKYCLFPEDNFSQSVALNIIKESLQSKVANLDQSIELFKKKIIDPLSKKKDIDKKIESDCYNQLIKVLSKYKDTKKKILECKTNYHKSVEIAEGLVKSAKETEIKYADKSVESQSLLQSLELKSKENFDKAKKNLEIYKNSIIEGNNLREESINMQKKLLNLYKENEKKDGEFIKGLLENLLEKRNYEREFMNDSFESMEEKIKNINLEQDLKELIKIYKSDEKPETEIKLEQFLSKISFNNCKTFEDYSVTYEIIVKMKAEIAGLFPEIDLEVEHKKQEMRNLCKKIFVINNPFTEEDKNKLMEYLDTVENQEYFLIILSKQRTNGRFCRTQKLISDLGEILNLILKSAEKENNFYLANSCMILSQTYFYDQKDEKGGTKKFYLSELIVENKWLRTPGFWRGLIKEMIRVEVKKKHSCDDLDKVISEANDKTKKELSDICFAQLLAYINNMKEFYIDDRLIVKIIEEFINTFFVAPDVSSYIYGLVSQDEKEIENIKKEIQDNPNFENELLSSEEVKNKREK